MRCAADKAAEAGIAIVGGHTIKSEEPIFGLCVVGTVHPKKALTNAGAQVGDALILTKPIGLGIISTAAKNGEDRLSAIGDAIKVMTEDPYRLAHDVRGIGFRTADAIAAKLGVEKTSPQRLRAGVSFALQTATDEGHCGLPLEMLVTLAEKLLEVDAALIRTAVAEELRRAGITLVVARLRHRMRDEFELAGVTAAIGADRFYQSVERAVEAYDPAAVDGEAVG